MSVANVEGLDISDAYYVTLKQSPAGARVELTLGPFSLELDEALILAAWIVAVAGGDKDRFSAIYDRVTEEHRKESAE